jgi:metal-dependent hydrolase (beta-lactamase superfamily II)
MVKTNFLSVFVLLLIFLVPQATPKDLNLTIVYDNNPYNEELETRWGFSCFIEGPEKTIMFDVGGEGSMLLKNMEKLEIDPKAVDVIVLSRVHYDHIGELSDFLEKNPNVTVYMPKSLPQKVRRTARQKRKSTILQRKASLRAALRPPPQAGCRRKCTQCEAGQALRDD